MSHFQRKWPTLWSPAPHHADYDFSETIIETDARMFETIFTWILKEHIND
jgi:hypothetical protein